ncbi:MAG: hypothetical protein A3H96_07345 [Acidobacteria bacterium RIFCSPLOWO2_02_FULL_67_36]|nr:MAG: hypothetical protein A3H96_07345 [Acidobacteria bacterium RIFCSPLOWO2_02_FULL_67_36]OFW22232.1 MAG: hypothetical protein A3G21_20180 [Acidobacteria bacterium RIFCSPLOWO2_12_FULL_66_21]
MNGMWAGYIWGEYASVTANWEPPRLIMADASLHLLETRRAKFGVQAVAWVRSVTVRDPASGRTFEKPSSSTVPLRFENNAVGVTFGLNTTAGVEAEGLLHVFGWP